MVFKKGPRLCEFQHTTYLQIHSTHVVFNSKLIKVHHM